MLFVVRSSRLLDRIFWRCAFATEGQRRVGAPPKSLAAVTALVQDIFTRKSIGMGPPTALRKLPYILD
jgi:hypothetical protein